MSSVAAQFGAQEASYGNAAREISSAISTIASGADDHETQRVYRKAQQSISQAQDAIAQMQRLTNTMPPKERRNYSSRLSRCRTDLESQQKQLRTQMDNAQRKSLMNGGGKSTSTQNYTNTNNPAYNQQRTRLLQSESKLQDGNSSLQRTQMTLAETQEIGANTLDKMYHQRETLQGTREKTQDTNQAALAGGRILRLMKTRAITNKIILWLLMIILAGCIGVVVYFGTKHK